MQPLNGAYKRVERAGKHLTNLNRRVNIAQQAIIDSVVLQRKPQKFQLSDGRVVNGVLGSVTFPLNAPIPPIINILIGETIYNLRAALDYLIYDLARLDSGKVINGTQFPIEDVVKRFKGRRNTFLKGLSDEHVAAVEGLQPCHGCHWTKILRDISNPDKHRHLTFVRHPINISLSEGSTEAIIAGKAVDVKKDIYAQIAFSDGMPVVETLNKLKVEITKTLDAFKPEFK